MKKLQLKDAKVSLENLNKVNGGAYTRISPKSIKNPLSIVLGVRG